MRSVTKKENSQTILQEIMKSNLVILVILLVASTQRVNGQQIQRFEIRPTDTMVTLGGTALLKCSVSSRHGDVQWIHDGTALGYDRKVPGKPRYSVIFYENEDTEYHLQIENVTLDDEGLYSCQAAPIGDWDTKLEAKAKLTVLVGPRSGPEMMFNDESKNSGEIVHFRLGSLKTTKFTCILRKAKPAGIIKWFLNNTLVSTLVGKVTDTKQTDGQRDDLTSVFELKQQTNQVYNNSIIRCQAYHQAFGITNELQNMSIFLRVVVVYPPSDPIITGYDSVTGIIAGSELRMVCSSSYTYPPAMLSWYRDGKLVSKNYDTIQSTKTTESLYRIGKVSPTDNKAFFKCNAINQAMDEPSVVNTTLNVWYGPEKLTMNGVFEVEVGKSISATCFSDAANPSPRLRFSFDGLDYEPSTLASTPTPANVAIGAYVVNGTYYQIVRKEHNNKELKCYAENKAANVQQIVTKQIKVLYPPDSLEITYNYDNLTVNEGTKVRVVCMSKGGNPLPEFEWTLAGKKMTPLSTQSIVYTVESTFDVILQREHHEQQLQCQAANKVGSFKKAVNLKVSYMPSSVNISIVSPTSTVFQIFSNISIKAGTRAVFACLSPNSNPQAEITWSKDSFPITFGSNEYQNTSSRFINDKEYETISYMSYEITSSDHMKEIRCDIRVGNIPRTMHGSIHLDVKFVPEIIKYPPSIIDIKENETFVLNLTSRANPAPTYKCSALNKKIYPIINGTLTFVATRADNTEFTCSLTNTEGTTDVVFKLNVKYPPIARVNNTVYVTTKGSTVQLYCIVDGNPLLSNHITWKSNNRPLVNRDAEQHFSIKFLPPNLSILTIINARDSDDGNFSCHVHNLIGLPDVAHTELRVKRTPQILADLSILKAGEDSNIGRSAVFTCKAKGFPDVQFKWRLPSNVEIENTPKYSISNTRLENQIYQSVLTIYSVNSMDYGAYLCEARSEIGAMVEKAILSGKHQPEQPNEFKVINITRNTITLSWKKNFDGGDAQKFRIRYRKDTVDPTYKYVETETDVTTMTLDNLDTATRYVINIQSFNKFGTEGFLREPLIVQTDFGFNEVNQLPIYNGNNLPLTIILIVCGVGTMLLLFNVALIVYLIKRKKRKGEADSTTDTNETDANTVEMFSPPPPYPDELNYNFDLGLNNFEDEYRPFVPHLHSNLTNTNPSQLINQAKYFKDINDPSEFVIEYASPMNQQQWLNDPNELNEDDVHINSLRQLDHKLTAALAEGSLLTVQSGNRHSILTRPFGATTSFQQNLNQISSVGGNLDNFLLETRAFPYERLKQPNSNDSSSTSNQSSSNVATINSTNQINNNIHSFKANSNCKLYQDVDEFKGHLV